jgi:hypothetical protein
MDARPRHPRPRNRAPTTGNVVNGMVGLVKAVTNPYIVGRVHIGYCPVCLSEGPYDEPCYRCHLPLYLYDDDPDYEQDNE